MENALLLGEGAFSRVYLVRNAGGLMACKVSCRLSMASREGQILAGLSHPLFPEYRGERQDGRKHYLYMEYIAGTDLKSYVRRRGKIAQARAVQIVRELAEGLKYLHEQSESMIFRDLKPENVMIQQDGKVRLVDLGCVYIVGGESNGVAGSIGYAAPEQMRKEGRTGMESDVYALGKLLCFMLTGQEHFDGRYPRGVSRGLKKFIVRTLQEDVRLRIPDMRTFLSEIEIYGEKNLRKRLLRAADRRHRPSKQYFYYKKNIMRGL